MNQAQCVDYDLRIDDLVAYSLHWMRGDRASRQIRLMTRIVLPLALASLGIAGIYFSTQAGEHVDDFWWVYLAFLVVYTLYSLLLYDSVSKRRLKAMYATGRNSALLGATRMELRSDALWRRTALTEGWVKWAGVEAIENTSDHLFIVIGVGAAYMVPRRAFIDQAAFEAFTVEARKLWQAARTLPSTP